MRVTRSDRHRLTRRGLLLGATIGLSLRASARDLSGVRIGIMDYALLCSSMPESFGAAADLGFEGVQVTLGKRAGERLQLSDENLQRRFLEESAKHGVSLASTYLDVLHSSCLKNDPAAPHWIQEGISITKALKTQFLELVFFGKCALQTESDIDSIIQPLKAASRLAEEAGIILGLENTLSADENARILDRIGSPAVQVWYDIGNSTNMGHYNAPNELRFLGRERICQIHLKDKPYLGEGAVDVKACLEAIADIGYKGFIVLEPLMPSRDLLADSARNLAAYRKFLQEVRGSPC